MAVESIDVLEINREWTKQVLDVIDRETGEVVPPDISLNDLARLMEIKPKDLKELPVWTLSRKRAELRRELRRRGIDDNEEAARLMGLSRREREKELQGR